MVRRKLADPYELFAEFGITLEYNTVGTFKDRPIRWLEDISVFQVGEDNTTFDRWANSIDFQFDLFKAEGQRAFIRWVKEEECPLKELSDEEE